VKILHLLLLAGPLFSAPVHAAENRYDITAKLLAPFINVLAKNTRNPNRAMALTARLERLTGLPPELAGSRAELSLEYPDRLFVHAPIFGDEVTVCRDRQQVWLTPGARAKAMLGLAIAEKKLPRLDPAARLEPFSLPIPEKQLVFLPALLVVKDAGSEAVEGEDCRVLDLALMPELEKSLKQSGWKARVWVRANYKPARLVLTKPAWELAVKFDKVEFSFKLAESTWQPPVEDLLTLDAPHFLQLLDAVLKR
jgi:hypothetical protein